MIKVIQADQAGKENDLLEMHRLRDRVFKQRMKWDVYVDPQGLEIDDFDIPEAIYLLALDNDENVVGCWRILPTNGPTMIRNVWPEFLKSIAMKSDLHCWEMSRFGVDTAHITSVKEGLSALNNITAKMFCGLIELCILCGITEIYTLYDQRIEKILRRLNCIPVQKSSAHDIDGIESYVGMFIPDSAMLERVKTTSKISETLICKNDLPPIVTSQIINNNQKLTKDKQ